MVLKIYGHPLSTYTQKALIALAATDTPYDFVFVDLLKGEHKGSDYTAKDPFGSVPCLDDDGFILFESLAIARYVAVRASSPLLPRGDGRAAARFEQALSVESSNFDPYVETIVFQRVFGPDWGKPTNEPRVQAAAQALEGKLQGYERILAAQRYLAGDEVTLADLIHLPWGVYLAPQGFGWLEDAGMYPNVARWWADINAHPAWKEVERMVRSMDATYDQTRKPRV